MSPCPFPTTITITPQAPSRHDDDDDDVRKVGNIVLLYFLCSFFQRFLFFFFLARGYIKYSYLTQILQN